MRDREIALVSKFQMYAEIINSLERIKKRRLTIAVSTIGSLSYFTNVKVIDMLGLTDEYIAHNPDIIPEISNDPENPWKEKRYNTSYVISRKPDYILFSTDTKPSAYAERALFTNNDFFYYYYIQFIPRPQGQHLYLYARKTNEQIKLSNPEIKLIKINANWVKDYVNLSQKYFYFQKLKSQERFESVKIEFDHIIKSSPSFFADTYRIMGDVYFIVGDINEAKSNYDKALLKDSLNVLSYLGLRRIYQNLKDEEKANFYMREIQIRGLVQEGFLHR
jgi:tetratricopeptide (TPR) repeat protein